MRDLGTIFTNRMITMASVVILAAVLPISAATFFGLTPMSGPIQYAEAHVDLQSVGGPACTAPGTAGHITVILDGNVAHYLLEEDIGKVATVIATATDSSDPKVCSYEKSVPPPAPAAPWTITVPGGSPVDVTPAGGAIACIGGVTADTVSPATNPCTDRRAFQDSNSTTWVVDRGDCAFGSFCVFISNAEVFSHSNNGDTAKQSFIVTQIIPFASTILTKTANVTSGTAPLTVEYTYNETNDGGQSLYDVTITDDKCAPVTLVSGDDGDGILNPGESWIFTCVTTYVAPGTYTNIANASAFTAPAGDPTRREVSYPGDPDEQASASVVVFQQIVASTSLTKSANVSSAEPGDTVKYTITETNTGNADIDNVVVTDSYKGALGAPDSGDLSNPGVLDADPDGIGPLTGETWVWSYERTLTEADCPRIRNDVNATGTLAGTTIPAPPEFAFVILDVNCIIIGGEILGIDATSLFVAGAFANAYWIVPVAAGVLGTTVGLLKFVGRRSEQQ